VTVDRGDLVWLTFGPHKGHEQAGRRPALVISPAAYNAVSTCVIVCPITTNRSPWPWKVMLPDDAEITGAVLTDQIKSIDGPARGMAASGHQVDEAVMAEVLARLATLTS
jgi:mRNA interferase MazF